MRNFWENPSLGYFDRKGDPLWLPDKNIHNAELISFS